MWRAAQTGHGGLRAGPSEGTGGGPRCGVPEVGLTDLEQRVGRLVPRLREAP